MRVISGSAKRMQLKTVKGLNTRPTTDRTKETLFNMISSNIADCLFMDLFSGSGAIGIEALSRGAKSAYFVEKDREAIRCIKENLKTTGLETGSIVMEQDILLALKSLEKKELLFDYIFMDPPYDMELEKQVLIYLATSDYVDEYTTIIVEASIGTDFSYLEELGFRIWKQKQYKTNQHILIERTNEN